MATLRENINEYRTYYLRQLTAFSQWSAELIRTNVWILSQKVNRASRVIAGYLRAFPYWLFTQLVHDIKQFYFAFRQIISSLFIIAQELPDFCLQLAKGCYKAFKSFFLTSYQFLSKIVQVTTRALIDTFKLLVRNIILAINAIGRLLKRTCLNLFDEIKQIPQYLTQAFILIKEFLRMAWEVIVELNSLITNAVRPVLLFLARKTLQLLTNTLVFILGFVAALFDLTLGSTQITMGRVETPTNAPKNAPSYTPNFNKTPPIIAKDKGTDDQPKNRPSPGLSAVS